MSAVREVIRLLTREEKRRLALISGAFCVMALLQVLGVGSIGPFMSVAAEPESIESSRYLYQLTNGMLFPAMEAFARGAWKGGSLPLASYRPRPSGRGTGAALSGSA